MGVQTTARRVAVLGIGLVDPASAVLRADDLGVIRGDGVFETMHVREGKPWLIDEHLARMRRSATRMEIELPDAPTLGVLVEQALDGWPCAVEASVRLICTRGPDGGGPVTAFAIVAPVAAATITARATGITLATASLGYSAHVRERAPWLLGGAKTLSYAINMASQRWAASHGVDDTLWISSDGYVMEAPTSTVVWLSGGVLYSVPADETGILPGTTARHLIDHAGALGYTAAEQMTTVDALLHADGVWLTSSVRGIAEVRAIDGESLRPAADTARMRELLGFTA